MDFLSFVKGRKFIYSSRYEGAYSFSEACATDKLSLFFAWNSASIVLSEVKVRQFDYVLLCVLSCEGSWQCLIALVWLYRNLHGARSE